MYDIYDIVPLFSALLTFQQGTPCYDTFSGCNFYSFFIFLIEKFPLLKRLLKVKIVVIYL